MALQWAPVVGIGAAAGHEVVLDRHFEWDEGVEIDGGGAQPVPQGAGPEIAGGFNARMVGAAGDVFEIADVAEERLVVKVTGLDPEPGDGFVGTEETTLDLVQVFGAAHEARRWRERWRRCRG